MRYGCCVPLPLLVPDADGSTEPSGARIEEAVARVMPMLQDAGCDFIELPVAAVATEGSEARFEALRGALASTPIVPECFNGFIPGDLRLVGPERDPARIDAYLRTALDRMAQLGGEIVVFGSAAARSVPEGYPREDAEAELIDFVNSAATHAGPLGLRIAIEPANRGETNIINSVEEGDVMARRVNRPNVGVLVDLYHVVLEAEPFDHIPEAAERLIHAHVADTGRRPPGTGTYDYPGFYAALKEAEYDARLSVECAWHDFGAELGPSLSFLRQAW